MKIWIIAWKDTLIRFRDRNALILMLAAPLLVTAIVGFAFGSFIYTDDGDIPITDIPFIIVNADEGAMSANLLDAFENDEALATLLTTTEMDDLAAAQEKVAQGNARAVLYIPPDFSERINPSNPGPDIFTAEKEPTVLQLYVDPTASITPNIIRGVITGMAAQFSANVISVEVTIAQIVADAAILGPAMADMEAVLTDAFGEAFNDDGMTARIHLNRIVTDSAEEETAVFDPFAFFGPGMGMFFLMFTALAGATSILDEQRVGTLDRLLITPTSGRVILLGKAGGVMLTGILQFIIFILATSIFFALSWGDPVGLLMMTLAFTAAAASLGLIIASIAKTAAQANMIGSPIIIISGLLGGVFIPATTFPDWLQTVGKLSINYWGLQGFTALTIEGLGAADVLLETAVLSIFALVFFTIATLLFQRRLAR